MKAAELKTLTVEELNEKRERPARRRPRKENREGGAK